MAKIHEQIITVKISKLVKSNSEPVELVSSELVDAIQELTEQLVGIGCVVEVEILDQS
jgi:hypothetical protein